ncbi:MAG: leucine-rich repeat domain-containing protein [Flavobacteriales bacterium]|nr:leucine-rich repeat domain-containing protein [Flavobacteriales bacterium]
MKFKVCLFLLVLNTPVLYAQLLDSVAISRADVYTSLKDALKTPEDVYVLRLKGKLAKVPKSVYKLVNLNKLDLSNNKFVDFPKGLEKLEFLQVLDLERNKMEFLGPGIGELTNLVDLNIGKNKIQGLAPEIGKLHRLERLIAWGNPLSYFPETLADLKKLSQMDLRVIQIPEGQQKEIKGLLPNTSILFSISCNCGN